MLTTSAIWILFTIPTFQVSSENLPKRFRHWVNFSDLVGDVNSERVKAVWVGLFHAQTLNLYLRFRQKSGLCPIERSCVRVCVRTRVRYLAVHAPARTGTRTRLNARTRASYLAVRARTHAYVRTRTQTHTRRIHRCLRPYEPIYARSDRHARTN